MKFKKVLITGCGGMLGDAVYSYITKNKIKACFTDLCAFEDWLVPLDVRDIDSIEKMVKEYKPDLILHLAAITDLELGEIDWENTIRTNAIGTENVALISKKYNATMVYISTAGVFDGKKDVYTDSDIPNPINVYGMSKHRGELFCQQFLDKFYIFRAGWMMGGGPKKDKKFINKIYKQVKSGKKELFIVNDKFGTPTYTHDFVRAIFKVIETGWYGLYNQVCLGETSRLEIAQELVNLLGFKNKIKINSVSSDYFKEDFFVPRPLSEKLINQKLIARNICYMRDWRECLKEYVEDFKKDLNSF